MSELEKKWGSQINNSSLEVLQKGFRQLTDMEVELEDKLNACREAKARFTIEIEIRLHQRDK